MLAILLTLFILVLGTYFMLKVYAEFKLYRDPVFCIFFVGTGAVMTAIVYAFLHFKPWLN